MVCISGDKLPSGFLSSLNEQQKEDLEEFRTRIKESEHGERILARDDADKYLLRFLRAEMKGKKSKRIFQVDKSFKRILDVEEWKIKHNIGEKPEKHDLYDKVYPHYSYTDYKAKTVVWISRQGEFGNNISTKHDLELDDWNRCTGYNLQKVEEELNDLAEKTGEEIIGYTSIADMGGLGLGLLQPKRIGALKLVAAIAADNFPETVGRIIICNTPWVFSRLFKIVSPLLDPETLSKFVITNKPLSEVVENLDLDLLPKEYGGNKDVEVPHCLDYRGK